MNLRILALSALILTACAPQATNAVSDTSVKTVQNPPAVGSYILYLQAKQDAKTDDAVKYLSAALKEDPDNKMLQTEMFSLLSVEGRPDAAYPYAKAELKKDPSSLLAALTIIAYDVRKNDYADALKRLKAFPDKTDNAFLFPLLEIWVQAGLGNRKKAEQALAKINRFGTEALYMFHSALLYDLWDDVDKARESYESLLKEPGGLSLRAAQAYGNFLLRHGNSREFQALVSAYRKMARSYALIDEMFFTAGAIVANRKVPLCVPDAKAGLAEAFFDISGSLADKGSPESSLFFIRLGLSLDSNLSLARILLGEQLEKLERDDEALQIYMDEKESSETYFASRLRAAEILARQGKAEKAEKMLRELADKRNDSPLPWIKTGDIALSSERFPQAVDAFTEALNRVGPLNRSHWGLFYSRGAAYERAGQWKKAEADLQKALMLAPEEPLVLNYLGYSWLERGKNIPEASEMLERAAKLAPNDGYIADSLGWSHYLRKQYGKASKILENAVSLEPGSATINDHLGDAYWHTGRKREARYQWKKALAVNDDLPPADKKRVSEKLEKGLDAVGDKVPSVEKTARKAK